MERGFAIQRLDAMESVVVRLASFASNTSGVAILPNTHFPTPDEFNISAHRTKSTILLQQSTIANSNRNNTATKTTTITTTTNASLNNVGTNSSMTNQQQKRDDTLLLTKSNVIRSNITSIEPTGSTTDDEIVFEPIQERTTNKVNENNNKNDTDANNNINNNSNENDNILLLEQKQLAKEILDLASETQGLFYFVNSAGYAETIHSSAKTNIIDRSMWIVTDEERECFSRLACIEAMEAIDTIDKQLNQKPLYPYWIIITFRVVASAGACAIWFSGSWIDMLVAGILGYIVAFIGESSILSKQEKIIIEAVACYVVGLSAGLITLQFPSYTCFTAMAISGIIDLLQGFRVVYAIVEIMSRNTVAGGADFLEGLLYTTLISFFLRVGQLLAEYITGLESSLNACEGGINQAYYFVLVPAAALSWSGLFNPEYFDLPLMAFHGILAFLITWACNRGKVNPQIALFVAAFGVTFSSGLVSRFTGRQAMGNTIAGLFVLVPGAYLVNALFADLSFNFLGPVIVNAAIIGTGAWTGTIFCSPTIVGTTAARLRKGTVVSRVFSRHDQSNNHQAGPMLFF